MRTTLDLDDALMAAVARLYPPGTPKTVVVEDGLRRILAGVGVQSAPSAGGERPLGFFRHVPVRLHDDFDAPVPFGDDDPFTSG